MLGRCTTVQLLRDLFPRGKREKKSGGGESGKPRNAIARKGYWGKALRARSISDLYSFLRGNAIPVCLINAFAVWSIETVPVRLSAYLRASDLRGEIIRDQHL